MTWVRREVIVFAWAWVYSKPAAEGSLTRPTTSKPARMNASIVR